jgi:hypothetical protein
VVHGTIERSDDPKGLRVPDPNVAQRVIYVIAERVERHDAHLPALSSMSRDFH